MDRGCIVDVLSTWAGRSSTNIESELNYERTTFLPFNPGRHFLCFLCPRRRRCPVPVGEYQRRRRRLRGGQLLLEGVRPSATRNRHLRGRDVSLLGSQSPWAGHASRSVQEGSTRDRPALGLVSA